jgi:RNA polymerase sigma factor (sigma-70 family)
MTTRPPLTEAQREARRESNRAIVDDFARERYRLMLAIARQHGACDQAGEDVVQQALLGFLQSFPGPDELSSAWSYLCRCIASAAWKAARRERRKPVAPLPEYPHTDSVGRARAAEGLTDLDAPDPADRAIEREAARLAADRLRELAPDQSAALLLSATGYRHPEAARILGISERAVRKRNERGNRRLRELRSEEEGAP